ncbi:hypothetical protein KAR02_09845 [Candidatus Bipolaricaulota bacterium]|nr:hypothetical protein [Candidatus Bipolaricaulota bacterium]
MSDPREEVAAVALEVPTPRLLDHVRGHIEIDHVVRLYILEINESADVRLKSHGGEYFALFSHPQILAQGLNGIFEISIDYRLLPGSDGEFTSGAPREVVHTIMSE